VLVTSNVVRLVGVGRIVPVGLGKTGWKGVGVACIAGWKGVGVGLEFIPAGSIDGEKAVFGAAQPDRNTISSNATWMVKPGFGNDDIVKAEGYLFELGRR